MSVVPYTTSKRRERLCQELKKYAQSAGEAEKHAISGTKIIKIKVNIKKKRKKRSRAFDREKTIDLTLFATLTLKTEEAK